MNILLRRYVGFLVQGCATVAESVVNLAPTQYALYKDDLSSDRWSLKTTYLRGLRHEFTWAQDTPVVVAGQEVSLQAFRCNETKPPRGLLSGRNTLRAIFTAPAKRK